MKTENILDVIHPNKPGLDEPEMRTLHCPYCKRDLTRVGPPHLAYGEKWGGERRAGSHPSARRVRIGLASLHRLSQG